MPLRNRLVSCDEVGFEYEIMGGVPYLPDGGPATLLLSQEQLEALRHMERTHRMTLCHETRVNGPERYDTLHTFQVGTPVNYPDKAMADGHCAVTLQLTRVPNRK